MSEEIEGVGAESAPSGADRRVARRRVLGGLAGLGASGLVGAAAAPPAGAADGDALVLGTSNASTSTTFLQHAAAADEGALTVRSSGGIGVFASTNPAAEPVTGNIKRAIYAAAGGELEEFGVANAIGAFAGDGVAVEAVNDSPGFPAVIAGNQGTGVGLGAQSNGHGPQVLLAREDAAPSGPPQTWAEAGSIRFDASGDLWVCITTGEPGTWTRLLREDTSPGRTMPITPTRVLDTRAAGGRPSGSPAVPGQVAGPLHGGSSTTLDLAGAGPIPSGARGVVGNLTVIAPTFSSHLAVGPAGVPVNTSALNFAKGTITGNAFTSQINATGLTIKASGTMSGSFHLTVDLTAYLT